MGLSNRQQTYAAAAAASRQLFTVMFGYHIVSLSHDFRTFDAQSTLFSLYLIIWYSPFFSSKSTESSIHHLSVVIILLLYENVQYAHCT